MHLWIVRLFYIVYFLHNFIIITLSLYFKRLKYRCVCVIVNQSDVCNQSLILFLFVCWSGVCGAGTLAPQPEKASAEGLPRRLPALPPHPVHPRVAGRARVHDGPQRVHERHALHCATGERPRARCGPTRISLVPSPHSMAVASGSPRVSAHLYL